MAKNDIGGVWRTIGGRRVFIKDGQDLASAMRESGKFKTTKKNENKKDHTFNMSEEDKKKYEKVGKKIDDLTEEIEQEKKDKDKYKLYDKFEYKDGQLTAYDSYGKEVDSYGLFKEDYEENPKYWQDKFKEETNREAMNEINSSDIKSANELRKETEKKYNSLKEKQKNGYGISKEDLEDFINNSNYQKRDELINSDKEFKKQIDSALENYNMNIKDMDKKAFEDAISYNKEEKASKDIEKDSKANIKTITQEEYNKMPKDYKGTLKELVDTAEFRGEDKEALRKQYESMGYDVDKDKTILEYSPKGTTLSPVKIANGETSEESFKPRAKGAKSFEEHGVAYKDKATNERFSDYLRDKYGTDDIDIITTGSEKNAKSLRDEFNNKEYKKYVNDTLNNDEYLRVNRPNDYMNKVIKEKASKKRIPNNLSKDIYELDADKGNAWSGNAPTKNANGDQFVRVRKNGTSQNSAEDIANAMTKKYPHLEAKVINDNEVDFSVKKSSNKTSNETMNEAIREKATAKLSNGKYVKDGDSINYKGKLQYQDRDGKIKNETKLYENVKVDNDGNVYYGDTKLDKDRILGVDDRVTEQNRKRKEEMNNLLGKSTNQTMNDAIREKATKKKEPKTIEVKVLQGNYGYGWDDLVEYDNYKDAKTDYKAYRENERNASHRIITRRVPNPKYKGK